jgi:hypothetical protein
MRRLAPHVLATCLLLNLSGECHEARFRQPIAAPAAISAGSYAPRDGHADQRSREC